MSLFWFKHFLFILRNNLLTDSRWQNKFDRTMTTRSLNNWVWPKLKPTNLLKPMNLNFTSGVLLISVPDVFSCRGAKRGWAGVPASASLQAEAGGPVQAVRTSIFFWHQVNVPRCREFRSNSKNRVRRCDKFSVMFLPYFWSSSSVILTSLFILPHLTLFVIVKCFDSVTRSFVAQDWVLIEANTMVSR